MQGRRCAALVVMDAAKAIWGQCNILTKQGDRRVGATSVTTSGGRGQFNHMGGWISGSVSVSGSVDQSGVRHSELLMSSQEKEKLVGKRSCTGLLGEQCFLADQEGVHSLEQQPVPCCPLG